MTIRSLNPTLTASLLENDELRSFLVNAKPLVGIFAIPQASFQLSFSNSSSE